MASHIISRRLLLLRLGVGPSPQQQLLRRTSPAATARLFSSPAPQRSSSILQQFLQQHQQQHHHDQQRRARDLNKSMEVLQNQLQEASQCVEDCREFSSGGDTTDEWRAELQAAEDSVNVAVACLVDLLDELRVSETEVATDAVVRRIKSLRAELVELKEQRPPLVEGK